jgi:hypothetical protein
MLCSTVRDGCVWCVPRYVSMSLSFVHKNLPHKVMEILKCFEGKYLLALAICHSGCY